MKSPFFDLKLLKKIRKAKEMQKTGSFKFPICKTWSRSSTILPEMVRCILGIHDRRRFIPLLIQETMVGRKLGEFAPTRHGTKNTSKGI